jgi:hypothetical protein
MAAAAGSSNFPSLAIRPEGVWVIVWERRRSAIALKGSDGPWLVGSVGKAVVALRT